MREKIRALIPARIRESLKRLLGIQFLLDQNDLLNRRLTLLENKFYGSLEELERDAKRRWQSSNPDAQLTWSKDLPGNEFIKLAAHHGLFGPGSRVMEIGPGYGRLPAAMLEENVPFRAYLGVDISENQVNFLRQEFTDQRMEFVHADVETFDSSQQFDAVISSLTFKHLFPSFEKAMTNIGRFIRPGGKAFIDFIEGDRRLFEADGVTFIRHYSRTEIQEIMRTAGFEPLTFDQVQHADDFQRLVIVAEKRSNDRT